MYSSFFQAVLGVHFRKYMRDFRGHILPWEQVGYHLPVKVHRYQYIQHQEVTAWVELWYILENLYFNCMSISIAMIIFVADSAPLAPLPPTNPDLVCSYHFFY